MLFEGQEMYSVEVYNSVRYAVMREGRSIRSVARDFGLDRRTVSKMLCYSVPPGYRRNKPPRRPKLDGFTDIIDQILHDDTKRGHSDISAQRFRSHPPTFDTVRRGLNFFIIFCLSGHLF